MLAGAFRYKAVNPVPTPPTVATCRIFASVVDTILRVCSTTSPRTPPPVPRHSRRRFGSSSKTRSGEDHRTPIGSRSRWDHGGDVRAHWTAFCRPSWEREMDLQLSHHEILRYWAGTPNQHHQANRLYRSARRMASPPQRHGASQRSPL